MSYLYLKGYIEDEMDLGVREAFPENCGIAAAIDVENASCVAAELITFMEKRGERGSGVVSQLDKKLYERRRVGPFSVQFKDFDVFRFSKELPGKVAIAHCRYATKGDPNFVANVQPLTVEDSKYGPFAVAHNGTLVNTEKTRKALIKGGCAFHSTSDTETLIHLILSSKENKIEDAIKFALTKIDCAYSLLIITKDQVFAIRDSFGIRPLSIAKMDSGYLIASETAPFDQFSKATYWRDVEPGEIVVFASGMKKPKSIIYATPDEHFCIFESIYFSNPRSKKNGIYHEDFRRLVGGYLARSIDPKIIDINKPPLVIPILDSGKHFAEGFANQLSKDFSFKYQEVYEEVLQRAHGQLGGQSRSFTAIDTDERIAIIKKKLHLKKEAVCGRTVILVDDSIVRSNTAKTIIAMIRQAGAEKIIFCVGFPPVINICPNGMDFQTKSQLIASHKSINQIKKEIGADELIYLGKDELFNVISETYKCGICSGCFDNRYPVIFKKDE